MEGTRSTRLYSSIGNGKEGAVFDDNILELSLGLPGERRCLTSTHQKRISYRPVIGWPPIGTFRKNLTNNKRANKLRGKEGDTEPEPRKTLDQHIFVKIYMEGFPIGRKVDLRAYDGYRKLSAAIDELFGGLVEADRPSEEVTETEEHEGRTREYTLVYEDNEGDRILAGDVPWIMFVSTAKKLHVIRSCRSALD